MTFSFDGHFCAAQNGHERALGVVYGVAQIADFLFPSGSPRQYL